jgi:hypothetical protein
MKVIMKFVILNQKDHFEKLHIIKMWKVLKLKIPLILKVN